MKIKKYIGVLSNNRGEIIKIINSKKNLEELTFDISNNNYGSNSHIYICEVIKKVSYSLTEVPFKEEPEDEDDDE